MANFGMVGVDWQQRVDWARLRKYRLERARERMKAHGLGALLLMYDENCRYVTSTLTPGWNRLKPGLRYALLCGDGAPVLFEQGDIGAQIQRHSPWIPPENVVTGHIMDFLYSIPGMEDVEDVIVSSGPNTWPNWRNFSDRIIRPGDIVFMDLAALTWNGYKSCYYRTYCVGKEPSQEQKDVYATALKWLYDSIDAVKAGTTTREIASKWPSAKDAYGYQEEDQAAANLWGHGLGLAQYDPPVISRIWSLDHPIEIKAGMVFALETQHGKMFRWGVRIEEMLIVHEDRVEIISNFPVQPLTVVDPIPGYGAHVK